MRIAIVDDIKEERAVLYGWLSNQLSKRNIPGDFVEFESGDSFNLTLHPHISEYWMHLHISSDVLHP